MVIINLIGLVLNIVGTILVSVCAIRVMICIHSALIAHQGTLEAHHAGRRDFPMIVGLDESREREMNRGDWQLRFGLALVALGFILQAIAAAAPLFDCETKSMPPKSLQPTAAAPVSWTAVGNLIVAVAFWSQSPAAMPEF